MVGDPLAKPWIIVHPRSAKPDGPSPFFFVCPWPASHGASGFV